MSDPFACAELQCPHLDTSGLDYCEKERHCPYAHQRRREEDVIERERKDAARRAEGREGGNYAHR